MIKTKVQRLKNGTLIISIPKTLAELINLKKGDYVKWSLGKNHKWYGKVVMMRTIEGEPYRFFQDKDKSFSMIPLSALQDQSPTPQTLPNGNPNGEHNKDLNIKCNSNLGSKHR